MLQLTGFITAGSWLDARVYEVDPMPAKWGERVGCTLVGLDNGKEREKLSWTGLKRIDKGILTVDTTYLQLQCKAVAQRKQRATWVVGSRTAEKACSQNCTENDGAYSSCAT